MQTSKQHASKMKILLIILFTSLNLFAPKAQEGWNDPDFFPISIWWQKTSNAQAFKDVGINIWQTGDDLNASQFTTLQNAGLKIICSQYAYALSQKNNPSIYGWMPFLDEPDNYQPSRHYDVYQCSHPDSVYKTYKNMKLADPARPVVQNLGMGVAYLNWSGRGTCRNQWWMYADTIIGIRKYTDFAKNGYIHASDIISFDIYPINSKYNLPTSATTELIYEQLHYVAKGVDSLKSWSKLKPRPTWAWIETTRIDDIDGRKPTSVEVKAEVWMALIHGVTGFGYFAHTIIPFNQNALAQDLEMMNAIKDINNQVQVLAPVLNSASLKSFASKTTSNAAVPVDILCKYYNGSNYIFAVPMRLGATSVTFTTTNTTATSVEVIGENRTIPITNGVFVDNFSNYSVRLYKLNVNTGVQSSEFIRTHLYPTHFRDFATLYLTTENNFPYKLVVNDMQGRVLFQTWIESSKCILKRNNLNNGMYILSLKNSYGKVVATQKFIIE